MTCWGLSHPLPPATPATSTPNESLRRVGGSLSPSTCDASHIKPQRVITTRWGLSLPLHLRCQPHQPPTSHYDSLGALSPLPPATPATSSPNESLRLVGGSLPLHLRHQPHQAPTSHYDSLGALSPPPPATPATSRPNESLRLVGGSLPLHLRRQPHQAPTSHYDSLGL